MAGGIALLCGAVGFSDPHLLQEVGTSGSDTLVSLPVLASLYALCVAHRLGSPPTVQSGAYGVAGLFMGIACGLKLTCLVYATGLTLGLLSLWHFLCFGLKRFLLYSMGGILGFLLTGERIPGAGQSA